MWTYWSQMLCWNFLQNSKFMEYGATEHNRESKRMNKKKKRALNSAPSSAAI